MKILIVDDNVQMRSLLQITFATHPDYQVFQAKNGAEALEIASRESPDIIFLDVMMPGGLDGLDVCRVIKSSDTSCFVVLLTAKGQQSDIELGLAAGADMYLTKPFSPIALLETVENFVDVMDSNI